METTAAQDVVSLRRVFDVSFVADSLDVAITDTSNRLLVSAPDSHLLFGIINIHVALDMNLVCAYFIYSSFFAITK